MSPNECIDSCIQIIGERPEPFYDIRHQTVFSELVDMHDNQKPIDVITLHQRLKDKQLLEQVGGIAFLNALQDSVPSAANMSYYAEVVKQKFILRKVINTCTEIVTEAYEQGDETDDFIDNMERRILDIRPQRLAQRATIKELIRESIDGIERRFENPGAITGLRTGFADIDKYIDGMHPGNLIVPAALPSVGKTSLLMNIVEHVVLNEKKAAAVFTLEMSAKELVDRFLSSNARVSLRGRLFENDFPKLTGAAGRISNSSLHIIDDCETVEEIRAEARRLKQQHNIELVGVDYIQRVSTRSAKRDSTREQEISIISKTLKAMAKELGLPVIAPSQLNDDNKLRESRAIGQDADGVWYLERDDKASTAEADKVDLWMKKNRGGPRGVCVNLTFLKAITRFESAAKISDEDVHWTNRENDHERNT